MIAWLVSNGIQTKLCTLFVCIQNNVFHAEKTGWKMQ